MKLFELRYVEDYLPNIAVFLYSSPSPNIKRPLQVYCSMRLNVKKKNGKVHRDNFLHIPNLHVSVQINIEIFFRDIHNFVLQKSQGYNSISIHSLCSFLVCHLQSAIKVYEMISHYGNEISKMREKCNFVWREGTTVIFHFIKCQISIKKYDACWAQECYICLEMNRCVCVWREFAKLFASLLKSH